MAQSLYDCRVIAAGPADDDKVYLLLKSTETPEKFPEQWFVAVKAIEKEMLATALTALSMGQPVKAGLDDLKANAPCYRLYAYSA